MKLCKHRIKHCATCDTAYCQKCKREWGRAAVAVIGYPPMAETVGTNNEVVYTTTTAAAHPTYYTSGYSQVEAVVYNCH